MKEDIVSLKIPSYKVGNKIEQTQILVEIICALKKIKLSRTEIQVLSHFMIEGYSEISKEQILQQKLLHSKSSLSNTLTDFRKSGILVKENFKEVLSSDFRIPLKSKININVTLDNS